MTKIYKSFDFIQIKRSVRPMMFDLLDTYEDTKGSMVIDKIQYNVSFFKYTVY